MFIEIVGVENIGNETGSKSYQQLHGVVKDPLIFAFEGIEKGSIVSISTVGLWWQKDYMDLFDEGYGLLLEQIQPEKIIGYGKPIEGLEGNITGYPSFATTNLKQIEGRSHA